MALAQPSWASGWKRADTHHFTIYSEGSTGQLEDFAQKVERFDALLRMLFRIPGVDQPNKLTIYVLPDAAAVDRLLGGGSRIAGFYKPRIEGSYAIANRRSGGSDADLSGQRVLFHEYAHHFMFRNFNIPAPAWYVEGFAEFVATTEFDKKGTWTFGKPANHRAAEVEHAPRIPIEVLLTEQARSGPKTEAFYGWAWALTHMLYSAERNRGAQINSYLNAINRGTDPLEAARANFGDLDALERDLRNYVRRSMAYSKSPKPIAYHDKMTITELPKNESDAVELTVARLGQHDLPAVRDKLRALTGAPDATAAAWFQLARAEFDLAHEDEAENPYDFTAAEAAVDRVLALDEGHLLANVLKGRILLEPFDHADDPDPANWDKAREYFLRANRIEPGHPLPLYSFAQSYQRQGQHNDQINLALAAAFEAAPEAAEVRYAYAFDEARQGRFARAISLLKILANDPHGGESGQTAIESIEAMRDGRSKPISAPPVLDEDD